MPRSGNVVPVVDAFVDDTETPVSAFLKLRDGGRRSCSSRPSRAGGSAATRSSASARTSRSAGPTASCWSGRDGAADRDLGAEPPERRRPTPTAPSRRALERFGLADAEALPFAGGAVGLFGYDLVRTVEPLGEPNPDPLGLPDLALMVCELIVAFDHHKHEVSMIALAFTRRGRDRPRVRARRRADRRSARERLRGAIPGRGRSRGLPAPARLRRVRSPT